MSFLVDCPLTGISQNIFPLYFHRSHILVSAAQSEEYAITYVLEELIFDGYSYCILEVLYLFLDIFFHPIFT